MNSIKGVKEEDVRLIINNHRDSFKDEILEAYLNIIYVRPNIYGVEMGSKYYFNKSSKDLTLEECAFLAGINNSPNSYNPFGEKDNSEKIKTRTKAVLYKMNELKYISDDEYYAAKANVEKGLTFTKGKHISDNTRKFATAREVTTSKEFKLFLE